MTQKRRTNSEILADMIKERQEKALRQYANKVDRTQKTKIRRRRTKKQIEADKRTEELYRQRIADARAAQLVPEAIPTRFDKTVYFLKTGITAFGKVWREGESLRITNNSREFSDAFDSSGNFKFSRSEEDQLERWGSVRYMVVDNLEAKE